MGEFDFTYRLPKTFKASSSIFGTTRIANVARAFQNCTYDYEDLGLAIMLA